MAQITIPDEQYHALVALAHERGMAPEQLVAALIEDYERGDQLAFWGEDVVANVRRQMAESDHDSRYLNEDEFFAELDRDEAAPEEPHNADL